MHKACFRLVAAASLVVLTSTLVVAAADRPAHSDAAAIYRARCQGCHGADGSKPTGGSEPLKGRSAEDMAEMMEGYVAGTYGGEKKSIMETIARKYPLEERRALAEYAATL